jgi:hypothetical protein
MSQRRVAGVGALVGVWLLGLGARAENATVRLVGDSQGCPAPARVAERLDSIVPGIRVVVGAMPGGGHTVLLWNDGSRYSVTVRGAERLIDGTRQSCDERARAAAVVVALALFPPPVAPHGSPTAVRTAVPRGHWLDARIAVGALLDLAPLDRGGAAPAAGLGVRAFVGSRRVGAVLGLGAVAWSTSTLDAVVVRSRRFPIDLGARVIIRVGPLDLAGELGGTMALLSLGGPGLDARTDATRLEAGVRVGALVRPAWRRRWAPFLAIESVFVARPFELAIEPRGVVATTPRARMGVLAGVEVRLR